MNMKNTNIRKLWFGNLDKGKIQKKAKAE